MLQRTVKLSTPAALMLLLLACGGGSNETRSADASTDASGWQRLFNGHDLEGWHIDVPDRDNDSTLRESFVVRNGLLVSMGTPEGHLITDAQYRNYKVHVEYRFAAAPGNCGLLVHVSTPRSLYQMFPKSVEVQMMHGNAGDFWCIVEDITVPDMEKRRGPREKWGVTEGMERRVINLTDSSEHRLGEWNTMDVTCYGDSIRVWVNGDLVNFGYDCTARGGQIALQAEGAEVEFREVRMKPITSAEAE